ncbi:MAG: D-Ala-D-Ala carboxypeptidase family metallohydrolase [Candidatus Buchananbacteria bacterium]|nr:D-Ala-D-Ala carboxypeptidase family metallohydrolase [Candidatus Buchananbacteria bacterium]
MINLINRKIIFYSFLLIILLSTIFFNFRANIASAQDAVEVGSTKQLFVPNVPIGEFKGGQIDNELLGKYFGAWYNFIVGTVGILATVIIMWGGFKWLTSRGNSAAISDAKDRIYSALIGLFLVFLSYTLLYLINPKLLTINLPTLEKAQTDIIETLQREEPQGQDISSGTQIDRAKQDANLATFTGQGIDVQTPQVRLDGLTPEIMNVTQQVREDFGQDITVTSGYDPERSNRDSQHIVGEAVDLERNTPFDNFMRNEVIGNAPEVWRYNDQPAYRVNYHGVEIIVIDETVNNCWHIDTRY